MKTGDIVFFRGTSPISRLIRFFTKSEYTHVALAIGDKTIIEADRFVNTRIREIQPSEVYEIYRVEDMTELMRRRIAVIAPMFVGYEYDYLQIFGVALRMIFSRKQNFFNRSNKFICSELIDEVFHNSGVPRKNTRPVGDVTPVELFEVYKLRKVIKNPSSVSESQMVK